jgi:hypothetical protein
MYVFIQDLISGRTKVFGPASEDECRAWVQRMRIHIHRRRADVSRLLSETGTPDTILPLKKNDRSKE